MKWTTTAPANIALIKYMGKVDASKNIASNPSLSYTLNHLLTTVELSLIDASADRFEPLESTENFSLSSSGQARFLKHLQFIKNFFNAPNYYFLVQSKNNFPADCGLASSASSFAALTKAACTALTFLGAIKPLTIEQQAELSRNGSGSSCRSFFSPWCFWDQNSLHTIDLGYENLLHQVIVVSSEKKPVTSTDAHQQVTSSLLFANRPQRANIRSQQLIAALKTQQWRTAYELCWQEFWDMHALFETATTPFGYMTKDTISVLSQIRALWKTWGDGPIVTLDAGPNIHLLYRPDQVSLLTQITEIFNECVINYA